MSAPSRATRSAHKQPAAALHAAVEPTVDEQRTLCAVNLMYAHSAVCVCGFHEPSAPLASQPIKKARQPVRFHLLDPLPAPHRPHSSQELASTASSFPIDATIKEPGLSAPLRSTSLASLDALLVLEEPPRCSVDSFTASFSSKHMQRLSLGLARQSSGLQLSLASKPGWVLSAAEVELSWTHPDLVSAASHEALSEFTQTDICEWIPLVCTKQNGAADFAQRLPGQSSRLCAPAQPAIRPKLVKDAVPSPKQQLQSEDGDMFKVISPHKPIPTDRSSIALSQSLEVSSLPTLAGTPKPEIIIALGALRSRAVPQPSPNAVPTQSAPGKLQKPKSATRPRAVTEPPLVALNLASMFPAIN
eukprot:m.14070 g.14070  ORF g.14070 m.14070 type:complete len:360 (+) comp21671_c0_seq1:192-1271(+)